MKAKASKPTASRKPGDEGLDYSDASGVVGGPVIGQAKSGLGDSSFGVESNESSPSQPAEKNGPTGK